MTTASQNRGFTLVETLVAISVLVVVIVGPMTLAAKGLKNAYHAREQLTATYLAQEGFELVRERRDSYVLLNAGTSPGATADWLHNAIHPKCEIGAGYDGCNFDRRTTILNEQECTGTVDAATLIYSDASCRLNDAGTLGNAPGLYFMNLGSGNQSPYTRRITLREIAPASAEVEVTVTVQWKSSAFGGLKKEVVLKGRLFDQYDNL